MTAKFLDPLRVVQIGPHRWRLLADLRFYSAQYRGVFIAPTGYECDFASVPRILGSLIPKTGGYNCVGVIHDAGYTNNLVTADGQRIFTVKQVADDLFAEGLKAVGVNWFQRVLMVQAVRRFGDPEGHPSVVQVAGGQ
jgi:hypothetical protein